MSTSPSTWRLIDTGPCDGALNMAVDEALLSTFDPASSTPVLRLYGWEPPALSLGRFQDAYSDLNLEECRSARVPVVRRITGGGVIFHASELTYSLVCAPRHLPTGLSVKGSFRHLTRFLLRFYEGLGLEARHAADACPDQLLGERTPFCFAGTESYDIIIGGCKIGGNAQRRLREAVFQHGSIPLESRVAEGLAFLRDKPSDLQILSLADTGVLHDVASLKDILAEAFRETMRVDLQADGLSTAEEGAVRHLLTKYQDDAWNLHGTTP